MERGSFPDVVRGAPLTTQVEAVKCRKPVFRVANLKERFKNFVLGGMKPSSEEVEIDELFC